ncbi:hypothetical protein Tco_1348996 [Tanacetum coccineum]
MMDKRAHSGRSRGSAGNQKTNDPSHDPAPEIQWGNILTVGTYIVDGVIKRRGTLYKCPDEFYDHSISSVYRMEAESPAELPPNEPAAEAEIKIVIHLEYPKQTITIRGSLLEKGRMKLCDLPRKNLDIFA